jgi:hypothetical protein
VGETAEFFKKRPETALHLVEFCILDREALDLFRQEIDKL